MSSRTTHSTCYMCTSNCPITVQSESEQIVSISHPDCIRATAMVEQREHEERRVLARQRPTCDDPWRDVSRDEALDGTAAKLLEIRERHGADSVAFAVGYTKESRPYVQRLAYAFGSPHYITESSCCFAASSVAAQVTLGREYGYFLGPSRGRFPETQCRLIWSNNPAQSQIPYERHHLLADAERVPTIVVDPRATSLAEKATVHLRLRPGTDAALALGLAQVIVAEGLHDQEFLAEHAHGFDEYRRYIQAFTPERTEQITGIPAATIVRAAQLFGRARPGQITNSANATTHHSNGFQAHRAILLLAALCGNLDVRGGNRPWSDKVNERPVNLRRELFDQLPAPLGAQRFPVFVDHYGEGQGMVLAEAIESGQIRAVVSIGMNVMMWPNSKRLASALRSLEVFTTSDFFDTPTTELATIAFPAATHLERQALIVAGNGRIQLRPASVAPHGDALGDTELVFQLAERLGLADQFWDGDIHASYDERLDGTGFGFADLPADGENVRAERAQPEERAYRRSGFGTATGKVEFASTVLELHGHDALPVFEEPYWSPMRAPEIARDFPLILTTGGRSVNYTHSQGRQFRTLRDREPEPSIQIHAEDASERGIVDGDRVVIASPLAEVEMVASVDGAMALGHVHAPHGWSESNINELIPDGDALDPISGFPPFKSSLCEVRKKDGASS